MTASLWALVAFALWTVSLAAFGIAGARVLKVLKGEARSNSFPSGLPHGPPWYRRVDRAHSNAVENLPVFAALVLVAHVAGRASPTFALFAQGIFAARVGQSLAHVASGSVQAVNVRFGFYAAQVIGFFALAVLIFLG